MSKWDRAVSGLVAVEPATTVSAPVATKAPTPSQPPKQAAEPLARLTVSMPGSEYQAADAVRRLSGLSKTPAASEVIRAGLAALQALPEPDRVRLVNAVIAKR